MRKKDWKEDRRTGNTIKVDRPISDRIRPSYHVRTIDAVVSGRSSKVKIYNLVYTEAHFENKEVTEKDPVTKEISTRPFTFKEGMRLLFADKSFCHHFNNRKACIKVAPSNEAIIRELINEGVIEPHWIGNQNEFLAMKRGDIQNEFLQVLNEGAEAERSVPAQTGDGIAGSKILQKHAAEKAEDNALALQEQETEANLSQESGDQSEDEPNPESEPTESENVSEPPKEEKPAPKKTGTKAKGGTGKAKKSSSPAN